ncbi:TPA: hypothetical protein HA281_03020 [Candidatus Woesearchaeota archaeon]|nr:hypothetical protein [Candidatus Woesearchaeota archaeon]HIH91746.1 hypothetical protein [Candidatus Woesearchaeota archaeon]HII64886.1 hypothetical protein [Candidatus Woesearchaeota archaeon]
MEKHEHEHTEHKKEHEHAGSASPAKTMDTKTIVMLVMVGLLVLVSAVQAVELMGLKDKLSDDSLKVSGASAKATVGASSGAGNSLSQNINSLPSMVGGC